MMKPIDELVKLVSTPARYLPLELNLRRKDLQACELRFCLAFPDTYEMGMSHLGARILYHLLNEQDNISCERAYAPWSDMEAVLREHGTPLSSQESQTPLAEFDVLGFSLTYELAYTNVINMLDLAGVPLLAADRKAGAWPLVIGGGPCASNPEPIAPFFDAFLFGDGEEAALEICRAVIAAKKQGLNREETLARLEVIEGVYVPSFFEPSYYPDGRIKEVHRTRPGPERIKRRLVADLETAYFPVRPLVPVIEPVHDRVMVEIARGCARGCRFCHAGIVYRPYRERSPEKIRELARESLAATGYEECSLLSLSASEHSGLTGLLVSLAREHYGKRVSLSLPSLRVKGLNDQMLKAIETVRKTGFTLAPEAATERLRKVINKDYSEEELFITAERVFKHGWRNLKLYFMIGLPTETNEDLEAIARLGQELSRLRGSQGRPQITISLSGFVPKPHTPFQWEPQIGVDRIFEIQRRLKQSFFGKSRRLKWHDPRMTEIEGVFSRGDRRLAPALVAAVKNGHRFDGWSEHFKYEGWLAALSGAGLDPGFYNQRERDRDEVFPWDHLDPRVSREWLLEERERAYRAEPSPSCLETGCERPCGVCDHETIRPRTAAGDGERLAAAAAPIIERPAEPELFFLYRVRYARRKNMKFIGQLEVTRLFSRLARRAQLPIRYSQGFHPQPRIMFGPPPPVGVASEAEFVDFEFIRRLPVEELAERLSLAAPEGIVVLEVRELPAKAASISALISGFDYRVRAPEGSPVRFRSEAAQDFMNKQSFVILQKREKGDREVDLRSLVKRLEVNARGRELKLGLRMVSGPGAKPQEVVEHVFGAAPDEVRGLEFLREEAWLKPASPVRYPTSGQRIRRERKT